VDQGIVFDDDVMVIGTRIDTKKYNKDIILRGSVPIQGKMYKRAVLTNKKRVSKVHKILINRCKANVVGWLIQANIIEVLSAKVNCR
jgi:hypothetical protein